MRRAKAGFALFAFVGLGVLSPAHLPGADSPRYRAVDAPRRLAPRGLRDSPPSPAGIAPASGDFACPPEVQWQTMVGRDMGDRLHEIHPTLDGGYLFGGESYAHFRGWDFWAGKLDGAGVVLWQRFYGGDSGDQLMDAQPTDDGGFVLGGSSASGVGETKTAPNRGEDDFWLLKIDPSGEPEWDVTFGGEDYDFIKKLDTTEDGGFLLGGCSKSPAGGNKTAPNLGFFDYWVVRLAADGTKLWDRSYGGAERDWLLFVAEASDGGYVLGGTSASPPGGNKTAPLHGQADAWIVRLDPVGEILWDRSFGGTGNDWLGRMLELDDGGWIVVGNTDSEPDGNKTVAGFGSQDGWLIRLDAGGGKVWERVFGGSEIDSLGAIERVPGGFLLGGASQSGPGGTKTSPLRGPNDWWLVRVSLDGQPLWDESYSKGGGAFIYDVARTMDGGVILGGETFTGPRGADVWILKLAADPGGCDSDADGVSDLDDLCPRTRAGSVVNRDGCAIDQLCPCDGGWRNHGQHVQCVVHAINDFFRGGLISRDEAREILRRALASGCWR